MRRAVEGDMEAQMLLGRLFRDGASRPRDMMRAYVWFSLSVSQGNKAAQTELTSVASEMSSEQVKAAQVLLAQVRHQNASRKQVPKVDSEKLQELLEKYGTKATTSQ